MSRAIVHFLPVIMLACFFFGYWAAYADRNELREREEKGLEKETEEVSFSNPTA